MILRSKHRGNFTIISNTPIRDDRLSAEALGVLLYLYSHPDSWRLSHKDLMKRFGIGRDKSYAVVAQLMEAGYVTKEEMRAANGYFLGHEYIVTDTPLTVLDHLETQ